MFRFRDCSAKEKPLRRNSTYTKSFRKLTNKGLNSALKFQFKEVNKLIAEVLFREFLI